jgi:Plasmid replication region DNA-binding N-term
MNIPILSPNRRGITQSDVSHAADSLLRAGERPTIEKVRAKIGSGSPNTINPMLDAWWKTLSARLDSGPAALHRLPETVAHVAEALWMQALEESRRRVLVEQRDSTRVATLDKERLELRSHVLSLREGELDSRLHDRERTIDELNLRLRELTGMLRKEQATRELQTQQMTTRRTARATRPNPPRPQARKKPKPAKPIRKLRRAASRGRLDFRAKSAGRDTVFFPSATNAVLASD